MSLHLPRDTEEHKYCTSLFVVFAFVCTRSVVGLEFDDLSSGGVLVLLPLYLTSPLPQGFLLLSGPNTMKPLARAVCCLLFAKASAWLSTSLGVGPGHATPQLQRYDSSRQSQELRARRISKHEFLARASCLSSSDISTPTSPGCSVFVSSHSWFPRCSRTCVRPERRVTRSTGQALLSAAGDSGASENISESFGKNHVRHTNPSTPVQCFGDVLPPDLAPMVLHSALADAHAVGSTLSCLTAL